MMKKRVVIILLVHVYMCWATSRLNARQFRWDDEDGLNNPGDSDMGPLDLEREDRKLIFINNKAYDLSEEEQVRVWDLYLKKGHVPQTNTFNTNPNMDSLSAAMNHDPNNKVDESTADKQYKSEPESHFRYSLDDSRPTSLDGSRPTSSADGSRPTSSVKSHGSVKASRFVADPSKAHLIEKVDEEEMQNLLKAATTSTTTPSPVERVVTEATTETSTVMYEYTQVSILSFLWNEFRNIGELLGREMLGSLSGTLYYLWESVVRYLKARSYRALQDMSVTP